MEYLKDALKIKVASQVLRSSHTFFLLDYDGTLTPIMPKPEMAKLRESTRKILELLSKKTKFSIGIITGRQINEIKSLVKLKNVIYAGNHGLEIEGPNFFYAHPKAKEFAKILSEPRCELLPMQTEFPGSFLEDKEITLTYHYRLVEPQTIKTLRKEFFKKASPWIRDKRVTILKGKKVLEIRPNVDWDKGSAVQWILLREHPKSLPIYIGDDKTDETAFKALNEVGVTVRVGFNRDSHAQYFMKDIYEVERFLSFMTIQMASNKRN